MMKLNIFLCFLFLRHVWWMIDQHFLVDETQHFERMNQHFEWMNQHFDRFDHGKRQNHHTLQGISGNEMNKIGASCCELSD